MTVQRSRRRSDLTADEKFPGAAVVRGRSARLWMTRACLSAGQGECAIGLVPAKT